MSPIRPIARARALAAALLLALMAPVTAAPALLMTAGAALFVAGPGTAAQAATTTTSPLSPNPLSGLPAAPVITSSQTAPIIANPVSTAGGGGLSGGDAIAIAAGAVLVLGGISFLIWRDARRRAPVRAAPTGPDAGARPPGSKRPKPRKLSAAERRRRKRGRAKPRR